MNNFQSSDSALYTSLDDDKEISEFLYKIDDFHDSVCHEIKFLYNACVFQNGTMDDTGGCGVKILFHSQFIHECPAYEIIFANVSTFHIANNFIGDCEFKLKRTQDLIFLEACPELLVIVAGKACYKILPLDTLPALNDMEKNDQEDNLLARTIDNFAHS